MLDLPDVWWPVLGCLLAAPNWRLSRGAMAGRLWPDKDEHSARHCLATALWRIKTRLPRDQRLVSLGSESIRLSLNRFDFVDMLAFERRAQSALRDPRHLSAESQRRQLGRALRHYRGSFLAERDQESIVLERERLRTLYLDALFALAYAETKAENWHAARAAAQALCATEPLREDAQRLLMTAHVRCGSRALALSQYRALVALLDAELGVAPMAETQRLAATIGGPPQMPLAEANIPERDRHRGTMLKVRDSLERSIQIIDSALDAEAGSRSFLRE
ncbi:MAG TPA: bacterial transcriptional activator domain-containing protein [Allosphingosinicella sp.]|nr:bacterial transcriptional activator domain-containing protein [Allosphingosinicella sp.]